jgi:Tfp pilus assembly ATPase PilU
LSTELALPAILAILLHPKALIIIIVAKTGPVNGGTTSILVITAYDSKAATDRATTLNEYYMYTKA